MAITSTLRRPGPIAGGSILFESDIADTTGLWFPLVEVTPEDRILCLFRVGWRFALFFDLGREVSLDIESAKRHLGSLYRRMQYADLYAAVQHQPTFSAVVQHGWFPFLQLMSGEFKMLLAAQQAGWDLAETEAQLLAKFDAARLDRIFDRWMARPILKQKEAILRPAIAAFKASEPVSVIKILLSEIEGVMAAAYFQFKGEHTRQTNKLLDFMVDFAAQHAGGKDTLAFPVEFGTYLREFIYSGYQPGDRRPAGSRHAVGHGAVEASEYTMTRALQVLLTLDQLAFYG